MNWHELQFEHPSWMLWAWLALLYVAAVCAFGFFNMLALRNAYSQAGNLNRTTRALRWTNTLAKTAVYVVMAGLVCLALAEPFAPNEPTVVPDGSLHLAVGLDVSPSMAAEDYRDALPMPVGPDGVQQVPVGPWGSRLMVAKWVIANQMMKELPGNRVSIGTYTADPWPQAPLCEDYSTLRFMLTDSGWIGVGSAPGGGSDYVQGLKLAVQQLQEDFDPKKRNIIVLFSDGGVSFANDEEKAKWQKTYAAVVAEVKALKAEVIIVGVGGEKPQQVPVYHPITLQRVGWFPVGAPDDKKETTALDAQALQKFANDIGGKYVNIPVDGDGKLHVDWVNVVGGSKATIGKKSFAWAPLSAAMLLFVLVMLRCFWRQGDQISPTTR